MIDRGAKVPRGFAELPTDTAVVQRSGWHQRLAGAGADTPVRHLGSAPPYSLELAPRGGDFLSQLAAPLPCSPRTGSGSRVEPDRHTSPSRVGRPITRTQRKNKRDPFQFREKQKAAEEAAWRAIRFPVAVTLARDLK